MVYSITDDGNTVGVANGVDNSRVWRQIVLSFLASIPFFTQGVQTTVLSTTAHVGHFIAIPTTEVPWTSTALILAAVVSAPIYCFLADRFGRRSGLYIISLSQGASCIPLFLPGTEVSNIILHVLAGVTSGGLFTILPIYIREISAISIRGVTLSLMMLYTTAGYLLNLVKETETLRFLMVGLVAVQFLTLLVMRESPAFLVKSGKLEAARTNLAKLKSLSTHESPMNREINSLTRESDNAKSNGNLTLFNILKKTVYRDQIKIGLVLHTIMVLCGSIVFLDKEKVLLQLRMPLETFGNVVLGCLVAGSFTTVAVIRFFDRKLILSFAHVTMMLSLGVLAVYTQADLTILESYRTVPMVLTGILLFAFGMAWGMPTIIMAEMLNLEIRSKVMCLIFIYSQLIKLAHIHTLTYIEDILGLHAAMYVFSSVNFLGLIYCLFNVPEIKDVKVRLIEKQLIRVPLFDFDLVTIKSKG